ncbi:MAG TPA: asparagine synthase-related protein [Candidatus Angelobacter sp.]|nr:asparagine synthase-related protein [Candidatus Angelobacter sp.]
MTVNAQALRASPELLRELRETVELAVERSRAEAILLSGGLDTSILAALASKRQPLRAYTIALEGAPSPDIEHANIMATTLGLTHNLHTFSIEEFIENLPEVVRTLKVFDPMEIRNSAAVYIGMKEAKKDGTTTILTGDACDELFAGYSFLFNLNPSELRASLKRLWNVMSFSAIPMARSLDMVAKIPFLDPEVKQLASRLDPSVLVVEQEGQKWGKWIVRKAFEGHLPSQITWRAKTPIEYGCGTTTLPQVFDKRIPDEEFHEKQNHIKETDGVTIRDKEHLAYYEIFRTVLGSRPKISGRTCPQCHYEVREDATFCRTCGAYPI